MAINFPNIDPVIIKMDPFAISWYSMSYVCGILFGYSYLQHLNKIGKVKLEPKIFDDAIIYIIIGIILGGRIGYILFYNLDYYINNPTDIIKTWNGGMSFHGGLIGGLVASYLLALKFKVKFLNLIDYFACATPIGLFLGRIANFINGNLYGKPTDVPWAVLFPKGGKLPRHPSQLYESFFEGLVILFILFMLFSFTKIQNFRGMLTSTAIILYGIFRFIIEYYREPDAHIGYIYNYFTLGQILSLPMIIGGLILFLLSINLKEQKIN